MARNVAIMIFDDVEILDFCGPYEVFGVSRDYQDEKTHLFNVYTIAEKDAPVITSNGMSVNPAYTLENCPKPDILLIPGGSGTRREMNNLHITNWVAELAPKTELVLSVCTGALILANAKLLTGLSATTYHTAFNLLQELEPNVTLKRGERFVDNGHVVTSAGISAGIDMSLYMVARLHGVEQARWTAAHMEYNWDEQGISGLL